MRNRAREYYRKQRLKHIRRKKNIIKQLNCWVYKYEGQLSKGKIHCSCTLCSCKKSLHGWKHTDKRKLNSGVIID